MKNNTWHIELYNNLIEYFNLAEIKELYFCVGLDPENFDPKNKRTMTNELIRISVRKNLTDLILEEAKLKRPLVNWTHIIQGVKVSPNPFTIDLLVEDQQFGLIQYPQFRTAIENFLTNYLGTEIEPVPFGGRDIQLAQLEEWRTQSKKQRLLLTAPAGRGKSALLVRWVQQLQSYPDVDILFFPVSARFGTNREEVTFTALAMRLAAIYEKEIPKESAAFTPQLWRGVMADFLREPLPNNKQLLIIIDGLDEAAWSVGEDLLPLNLPSNVRVVISARYLAGEVAAPGPWLRRLGWDRFKDLAETLTIDALSVDGVRDVLNKMDCPLDELETNFDIVSELFRLSKGDPLLVELYVKDLWARGEDVARLQPKELQQIEPGYHGFFENWWDDQEKLWGDSRPMLESHTRRMLNLLAIAFGPLTIDDLHELLSDDPTISGRSIRESIKPLRRFILGDGSEEQGFIFAHPKLGEYFESGLTIRGRRNLQKLFIKWGQETVNALRQADLEFNDVSLYLLQYLISHFNKSEVEIEAYFDLLSYEWMKSWHRRTGIYSGFLRDVDLVWQQIREINRIAAENGELMPLLGVEIRCGLYRASIKSLAKNLTDDLLIQLLQTNLWTEEQVLAYARYNQSVSILIKLRPHVQQKAQTHLLSEILLMSKTIQDGWTQANVFTELSKQLKGQEKEQVLQLALKAITSIQHEEFQTRALIELAEQMNGQEKEKVLQRALEIAATIQNEWAQSKALTELARQIPASTLEVVVAIQDEETQANVLTEVAKQMPEKAFEAAVAIKDDWYLAGLLIEVAKQMPEKAYRAVQEITDEAARARIFTGIARHMSGEEKEKELQRALEAAQAIEDKFSRTLALIEVAKLLSGQEKEQIMLQAVELTKTIQGGGLYEMILTKVAEYMPEVALEGARSIQSDLSRSDVLTEVAKYLPEATLEVAKETQPEWLQGSVLMEVAKQMPEAAFEVAASLPSKGSRAQVLTEVAKYINEQEKEHVLQMALDAATIIQDDKERAAVLAEIAKHMPKAAFEAAEAIQNEPGRASILIEVAKQMPEAAFVAAREIHDARERARVLIEVAKHTSGKEKAHIIQIALEAAKAIQNEFARASLLIETAKQAPEVALKAATSIQPKWSRKNIFNKAASAIRSKWFRASVLTDVANYIPENNKVVDTAIQDEWHRARVLIEVAKQMPEAAFEAAKKFENEGARANVLIEVTQHLPETVMSATKTIQDEWQRARVLTEVATYMSGAEKERIIHQVLTIVSTIQDESQRMRALTEVAKQMPKAALEAVSMIQSEQLRANVLIEVAKHMPEETLKAAKELQNARYRANVFIEVAKHMSGAEKEQILLLALETNKAILDVLAQADKLAQAINLIEIAKQMRDEEKEQNIQLALETIASGKGWRGREPDLDIIVRQMKGEVNEQVMKQVFEMATEVFLEMNRTKVLSEVANQINVWDTKELSKAFQKNVPILANRTRYDFYYDISVLLPIIETLGGKPAIQETFSAVQDVARWWR